MDLEYQDTEIVAGSLLSPDSSKDGTENEQIWISDPPNLSSLPAAEPVIEEHSISEDISCHDDDCCYARWLRQKAFLLTDGDVHSALVEHYLRKCGSTMRNASGTLARAMQIAENDLAEGPIREYLDSQRNNFDVRKSIEVKGCRCPAAVIPRLEKMVGDNVELLIVPEVKQIDVNLDTDVNMNVVPIHVPSDSVENGKTEEIGEQIQLDGNNQVPDETKTG